MNVHIIYATMTKHTKKLADYLADSLKITAQDVEDKPNLANTDVLFVGSGIYGGKISPNLENYIKSIKVGDVKKAVIFLNSCGGKDQSKELRGLLEEKQIKVYDKTFICKGKWLLFNRKHPNEEDCIDLVDFSKKALSEI